MNNSALDLKDYVEHKDMIQRYGRQDIIYVLLDKRIDHLADDIKDLKGEMKDLRGEMKDLRGDMNELRNEVRCEIKEVNLRVDGIFVQMASMKRWGIGLLVTILLGLVAIGVTVAIALLGS